ncbi:hypothetical protein [Streptomyces europaeiscabiei]|uniref:hypothetical protein n=1 Tax=Streptomyces europaeiscabiei TaxID=146819 RepID=UPI0029B2928D|nr:hypothetical protein [Streptomyces europaeiscabiei]MDX2767012.1 hypothetical protein [Streptomyces europaeiscabiei]
MRTRIHTITALAVGALLALTACSADEGASSSDAKTATSQGDSAGNSKPATLDAEQAVKALANAISNTQAATVYTAATDPNKLLGRPGGYTSKADFTDDRAKPKLDDEVQNGGSVEVFEDPAAAEDRAKFIAETLKAAKIFGTEYHYVNGGVLLRVSGALTPDQAAEYEAALKTLG